MTVQGAEMNTLVATVPGRIAKQRLLAHYSGIKSRTSTGVS
jgi:hypothetical protein